MPYTDFHYTPTGTGVISGKEVLEQTEDAINDLGGQISGDVQTAIDTANNALNVANTASTDAQNAVNTANTAYTAATNAQNTANTAQNTASNALTAAQTAQNDVNALGNRVTTAENNISQNTTDISGLTTRMGTAEGNITTLQNDVVTAQGTATSAQNTATMARQQAYVLRYSSTAITDNSTIAYSTLDNTDNIKVSDKIIDTDGKIFSIVSVDSDNSTVTVGSALIDLAQDSDVVHKSGNETISGVKTFSDNPVIGSDNANITVSNRQITANSSYSTPTGNSYSYIQLKALVNYTDSSPSIDATVGLSVQENAYSDGKNRSFSPSSNNIIDLGLPGKRWANVYATNYYYGSSEVEFSTKFVTSDTNQTITGAKTFEGVDLKLKSVAGEYTVSSGSTSLLFYDKNSLLLSQYKQGVFGSGISYQNFSILGYDSNNQQLIKSITFSSSNLNLSTAYLRPDTDNAISLGRSNNRWSDVQTYKVNGVEPSSLSLPSGNVSDVIDISSYITALDGTSNSYTVPANGWISIAITGTAIAIVSSSWSDSRLRASSGNVSMLYPVLKNETLDISVTGTTLAYARFIPCQGNV